MSRISAVTVTCPVCESSEVECLIDPGEPAITSGPSDGWYPGVPAGLDDWDSACQCGNSPLVDESKYRRALEARVMDKERF